MTDNPQWQPGQPPPPPSGDAGEPQERPYADQPGQSAGSTPQGGWQGQPQEGWQDQQGYQPQQAYQHQQEATGEERTWMMLAHLSAPIALIVSLGWLSIVGPLLVWFLKKDSSPRVRQSAAGAFNFTLSFWLMAIVGWICFFTIILIPIAIIIWIIVFITAAYVHLRGAWLASKGQVYIYPFQVRVLS